MKKILSLALLGALAQAGHAQTAIKAGTVQLGGSINYSRNAGNNSNSFGGYTNDYGYSSFAITPSAGCFIANNLSLGLGLGYSTSSTTYSSSSGSGSSTRSGGSQFQVGPVLQYYRMLSDQFGFTGAFGGGYQHAFRPGGIASGSPDATSNGFYAQIIPGIIFMPVPRFGIGASIGGLSYNRSSIKYDQAGDYEEHSSVFGAGFGLNQLTFTGTYFFRK